MKSFASPRIHHWTRGGRVVCAAALVPPRPRQHRRHVTALSVLCTRPAHVHNRDDRRRDHSAQMTHRTHDSALEET